MEEHGRTHLFHITFGTRNRWTQYKRQQDDIVKRPRSQIVDQEDLVL